MLSQVLLFSFILTVIMYMLFIFIFYKMKMDMESISPYECGFDSISLTRNAFSYRFYLISILFIIFDVEISLMMSIPYFMNSLFSMWFFLIFILILIVGLMYEYNYGSLNWLSE